MERETFQFAEGEKAAEAFILAAHRKPLTEDEIADLFGVPTDLVSRIHHVASRRLREALNDAETSENL